MPMRCLRLPTSHWHLPNESSKLSSIDAFARAGEHRLAAGQLERAVPLLSLAISSRLAADDREGGYAPARSLVDAIARAPGVATIDPEIVELIRRAASAVVADALPESGHLQAIRDRWEGADTE